MRYESALIRWRYKLFVVIKSSSMVCKYITHNMIHDNNDKETNK